MKEKRKSVLMIPVLIAILMGGGVVHAQFKDMWGTKWNNSVSSFIGSSLYWKTMTQLPKKDITARTSTPLKPSSTPNLKRSGTVTFQFSGKSLMAAKLAASFTTHESEQKEMIDLFLQFLSFFHEQAVTDKEPYDVSRAATYFIAVNYGVATGKDVTQGQIDPLQKALRENLAINDTFQAMNQRQRQELYETLVIFATLAQAGYHDGETKKSQEQMANFREFARAGLKTLIGATPDQMKFTDTGLAISN